MRHNAANRNQQQNRALCIKESVGETMAARGSSRGRDRWEGSGVVGSTGGKEGTERNARPQEQLVVHNLSLVISVARKFMGRGVRLEDLVQEGNYGLLKAIEHFDPEKGNRFSTYAVWWIRAYIPRCLKDGPSAVRRTMPNGGLPPRDISLEESLDPEGESTHLDRLSDDGPTPDEQIIRAERQENVRNALGRVRKRMGELAWDILSDRLTQDDPRTLEDLGKQWGLSRERVRQVEKSTRNFLSRYLADFEEAA